MKKNTRRRRAHRAVAVFLAVTLALVGLVLSLTLFFKITDVRVEGQLRMHTEAEILAAADIKTGSNLFRLNAGKTEKTVWSSLPYIESVNIRRRLPGTIVIEVREIEHLFAVEQGGQYVVVSGGLKILDITAAPDSQLPVISGITAAQPTKGSILTAENTDNLEFFAGLIASLDRCELLSDVTAINVGDKLNYTLVYNGRIEVMIGTANNLDYKLDMLREVVQNKLAASDEGYLDISDAGRAIFKPKSTIPDIPEPDGSPPEAETPPDEAAEPAA